MPCRMRQPAGHPLSRLRMTLVEQARRRFQSRNCLHRELLLTQRRPDDSGYLSAVVRGPIVERTEMTRLERQVNDEVLTRFPAGAVQRVALLQEGDQPQVGPEELLVRGFVGLAVMPHEGGAGGREAGPGARPGA